MNIFGENFAFKKKTVLNNLSKMAAASMAAVLAFTLCVPANAAASTSTIRPDDLETFATDAIEINLFNYSQDINKDADGSWRDFIDYFSFRGGEGVTASTVGGTDGHVPNPTRNDAYDADGFTETHATVLRTLDENGNPWLDPARKADGTYVESGIEPVSLAYLFDPSTTDHAVEAYSPSNTMLVKSGTHYYYNSKENAVDYDASANVFRVRNYVERNSDTAASCTASNAYGDYLPFNHTGGATVGQTAAGVDYQIESADVDYWFGTTIEVDFYQLAGGQILDSDGQTLEDMVFSFSGDDDVWVFVDNVLVLDLGGTHGTVNGTINFATGEIQQYLTWGGKDASNAETSFPTTIKDCFEAANAQPNGGWGDSGETFADFSKHTLKFFYLERGSSVTNCKLDFNLPVLPDGDVTVTKALSEMDDEAYVPEDAEYRFVLYDGETHEPVSGAKYSLVQTHAIVEGLETGADGGFSLKAYETASFQLDSERSYYVVELDSEYAVAQDCVTTTTGSIVSESDKTNVSDTFIPDPDADGGTEIVFTNALNGSLEVGKVVTGEGGDLTKEWMFEILLSGEALTKIIEQGASSFDLACKVDSEVRNVTFTKNEGVYVGAITLKHGLTAIFEQIPAYVTFSVTEIGAAAAGDISEDGYATSVEGDESGTIRPGISSSVEFTNDFADSVEVGFAGMKVLYADGEQVSLSDYPFSFEFELAPVDGAKMPEGAAVLAATPDAETGKLDFGSIEYTYADLGEHVYVVSEVDGGNSSIDYAEPCQVTVSVTRDEATNELSCDVRYETLDGEDAEGILFVNQYTTPELVSFQIEATKALEGGALEAGMFSFQLEAVTPSSPMPEGAENGVATASNDAGGAVLFPEIWVAEEDANALGKGDADEITYSYKVTEANLGEDHYTYDDREYVVKVMIGKNAGNELEVRGVKYLLDGEAVEGISFENVYDPPLPETGLPSTGDSSFVAPLLLMAVLAAALMVVSHRRGSAAGLR